MSVVSLIDNDDFLYETVTFEPRETELFKLSQYVSFPKSL